jgi:two-component system, OmpR family, alkaline phosphatase synthesis response regulator PhoP
MAQDTTICVVEDDAAIRQGLVDGLSFAGYRVLECADGESARRTLMVADLDLVLLDVVLPGMDGIDFLPELRKARPLLPVILVTARGSEEDRVRGLRNGADDYVVKPFSSTELLARVEAVLRRSAERPQGVAGIRAGGLQVHLERREVHAGDEIRQLTEREAEVLIYLARSPSRAVSRDEFLRHVWRVDPRGLDTRTVDMAVLRLREKLVHEGVPIEVVVTVRGMGYMLAEQVEVVTS